MPEVFCVDLLANEGKGRDSYKGKTPVAVLADVVWFDEGYQRAVKGDVVKLDAMDARIFKGSAQVEFLDPAAE
jgi:hypothetical protein